VIEVTDNIYYHLDRNEVVMGLYLDLRKADDRLNTTYFCGAYIIMAFGK
jgi:hypothetical protein